MEDVRASLAHVLWIGGGPQAGKTTLSRLLAGKYDLAIYDLDSHGASTHRRPFSSAEKGFAAMSMDERWALPSVPELVERSIRIWEDRFARVTDDLLALPRTRTIVAEGPGALPWCVAPLLRSRGQAIFLVPTAERREIVAVDRWGKDQAARFPGIVRRAHALKNVRERDSLMDELAISVCEQVGLRWERVDGTRDLDASLAMLEEHFAPLLPKTVSL